ncbi:uncharacterized protein FTJAE_5506 [Fusarium tjaetaba]|uniref:Uncharacterized protein n=1 Tax=Fusarium tjaetaba TaxID=1567544 RepID=A0A8H5RSB5_9HYPO|nr:uncharacterized protein FTJAE_5506 [Fusarium tjaetaba]KAF5637537.1 hypothetical protein FTJAE_5506 [Fusarium tjaetaba]
MMDVSPRRDHFPLLGVPNEVLRMIMEKASEQQPTNNYPNQAVLPYYGDLLSSALVCSRLNAAATEVLYSCICIYTDEYRDDDFNPQLSPSTRVLRLHRTLRENIELRRFCTRFILHHRQSLRHAGDVESLSLPIYETLDPAEPHQQLSAPWPKTCASIILDCTNWLFNTRTLVISGGVHGTLVQELGEITFHVLSCARMSMPRLECIDILNDISFHRYQLTSFDIQLALGGGCLNLKHLMIRQRVCRASYLYRSYALGRLHNSNPCSGFSLTSLTLTNLTDHHDLVRNFMTWLKGLKHFTMRWDRGSVSESTRDFRWRLELVGDILKPHRDSIKSIKLGKMAEGGLGNFDASNFPNLETLHIHHKDLKDIIISTCPQLQAARLQDVVMTTDNIEEEMFYNASYYHE